ncbi:Kinesin motor domain [Dillenia turbinata]|uniref:Kinesin motor domain n=1 Tax=Dillenia turbinata TaxID=194707 RepID=A0AAN8US45_9MAGN
MLKDFKFLRRNSGKNQTLDEIENVPVDAKDLNSVPNSLDPTRAPLNTIPDPTQKPKTVSEQVNGFKSKNERATPTKVKSKSSDPTLPLRTPEKLGLGFSSKHRFGWGQKNEPGSVTSDACEEGSSRGFGGGNGGFTTMTPRGTRAVSRATSSYSESTSTQSTPTKSVTKPPNPGFGPYSCSRPSIGGARTGNYASLSKGIPISCGPPTIVNTVEVPHFDLKEDPSFWMEHNVQVIIRVRPLNSMERSTYGFNRCLRQDSAQSITWIGQPETRFTFDHVACETVDQEMLFRMAGLSMVENCLSGYNSCMFAYGQTGSGKTYTMLGEIDELEVRPSPNRGMTPRIFEFLFARIRAEEESRRDERLKYNCKCSFLEIYNEQITDLLDPSSTNLLLREDIKKGVYVENLSEFEVHTVSDILGLLTQGSSNRKVAATNMNRESSRSHSVFTCVIESRWEKDSTTNLRFARLNLVDLAGSERYCNLYFRIVIQRQLPDLTITKFIIIHYRQKASGAEGERLKEAANINKSLSTLGHVIMVLLDVAHGKPRHVPYRDSRLTFLLQDSLGGNSKTMIIANVSPSICTAAETLNTLKFAQRAKLIQNNAVVNEDSSGDITALQHQIRILKEELAALRRQHVSRSLSFNSAEVQDRSQLHESACIEHVRAMDQRVDDLLGSEGKGSLRVSSRQLKSLETTLAGAFRREQMAETSVKQLEAEIEQLNRLVRQREEDTRSSKMMLKFREDKIQRMESLIEGLIPADTYLLEENAALCEENRLLRAKVDKNPEVTRFALENIRLLDQLRRFQEFYEEGERDMLLSEVSELRDQLVQLLDRNPKQQNLPNTNTPQEAMHFSKENGSLKLELESTLRELEDCRSRLNSCLEDNAKLRREMNDLHSVVNTFKSATRNLGDSAEIQKESLLVPSSEIDLDKAAQRQDADHNHEALAKHGEYVLNLELELDILKIIVKEESSFRAEFEERELHLKRDLQLEKDKILSISDQNERAKIELAESKSVIEALESQQILSINEIEDLRNSSSHNAELLKRQEAEIFSLKEQLYSRELRDVPTFKHSGSEDSPLQAKLKRVQDSLEMAKRLNTWYQSDYAHKASNEEEMDEIRRQVEAETAEVIVCLQEELAILQEQVQNSNMKEMATNESIAILESKLQERNDRLHQITQDNKNLSEKLEEKEERLRELSEEWELMSAEILGHLTDGSGALVDASEHLSFISNSIPQRRSWISEQVSQMIKYLTEKEILIEDLNKCLVDANNKRTELESMLRSLRGATLVITEAHQQECSQRDEKIVSLMSELGEKTTMIAELENRIRQGEDQIQKVATCATVAFLIVNRMSETNSEHLEVLKQRGIQCVELAGLNQRKDALLKEQVAVIEDAGKQIQDLRMKLEASEECCGELKVKLSDEQKHVDALKQKNKATERNNILCAKEKLEELKIGISTLSSCVDEVEHYEGSQGKIFPMHNFSSPDGVLENWADRKINKETNNLDSNSPQDSESFITKFSYKIDKCDSGHSDDQKLLLSGRDAEGLDINSDIGLFRTEIDFALQSLNRLQAQVVKLRKEKDDNSISERKTREKLKSLITCVLTLQSAICSFEKQSGSKIAVLDSKLQSIEEVVEEVQTCWCQTKELLELEVGDAKLIANQRAAEASCILAKFEEAQDTMKDADIIVNELMIANEAMKLEMEGLKKNEVKLVNERDILFNEVQSLQHLIEEKDLLNEGLVGQLDLNLKETSALVLELNNTVSQVCSTCNDDLMSLAHDFHCLKSQLLDTTNFTRSWLEDIWSEIIARDCAMSVLHLCHVGILLEAVTGLNAENGLLHHGLHESNSVIADLREHNSKSRKELEMCRILKGKLLADIKSSLDRISRKEVETGRLGMKITTFEKKILDLQLQEEVMLQRSNHMGVELATLMKELDLSNEKFLASLMDQDKLGKDKEEIMNAQAESLMISLFAKETESLVLASELEEMAIQIADVKNELISRNAVLESAKEEMIFLKVDADLREQFLSENEAEVVLLQKAVGDANMDREDLCLNLKECWAKIEKMNEANNVLEKDIQLLKKVAASYDSLKNELNRVNEVKERMSTQIEILDAECRKLQGELKLKEADLKLSSHHIAILDEQNQSLQNNICMVESSSGQLQSELDSKDAELERLSGIVEETKALKTEVMELKSENSLILKDLEEKKSELELSVSRTIFSDVEHNRLKGTILSLETCISNLQTDLRKKDAELNELRHSDSLVHDELQSKSQELLFHVNKVNELVEERIYLYNELRSLKENNLNLLSISSSNIVKCDNSLVNVNLMADRIVNELDLKFQEICATMESSAEFNKRLECLEGLAEELISENLSHQTELFRKEEVLKGLLFDLSLLQESASGIMDQKDKFEEMVASLDSLEDELEIRTNELDEAVAKCEELESKLQQKVDLISMLELDISKQHESIMLLSTENSELETGMKDALGAKGLLEEQLIEQRKILDGLEMELSEMTNALDQMNNTNETLRMNMKEVTDARNDLHKEVLALKEKLELAQALAEENEVVAMESQQLAESRKMYAEDKEEEIKLLERSVEELECTINVLENKVDLVKGEAERQRLQREELELELHGVKHQMENFRSSDAEMKRLLDEKEKTLQETLNRVHTLERAVVDKEAAIEHCKTHISELNLHAEAQACEYKQKFKDLEAMIEQVKLEGPTNHFTNTSSNKSEKNPTKPRGSGSPFKCIGLGITQQIKSEKDEELTASRLRIEELEALAANRQKEIFMLNTKLAAAESMTHDVIRDLLGVKLDMTNYASLLDSQQYQKITEKARFHSLDSQEQEVNKLKQQLNKFIEERKGWLEEIDRKQAELVAAHVALEKLHQRDRLLTAENEMLKVENTQNKKKVMEIEAEEENNILKAQNEDLGIKHRRAEAILSRVKEELARYRASGGRSLFIDFDEEQRLKNKLKETEEERLQLAQKLLGLCTSILKTAGITGPVSDISAAEDALEQLGNTITSLERELEDLKFKDRIASERIRLSELKPHSSTFGSRTDENFQTPIRGSQTPFLSALDR